MKSITTQQFSTKVEKLISAWLNGLEQLLGFRPTFEQGQALLVKMTSANSERSARNKKISLAMRHSWRKRRKNKKSV